MSLWEYMGLRWPRTRWHPGPLVGWLAVPGICAVFVLGWLVYKAATWSPELGVGDIGSLPPVALLLAAVLLIPITFTLGQYYRGFMHARGIWQSHKHGISGGGGMLVPLAIMVIVIAMLAS